MWTKMVQIKLTVPNKLKKNITAKANKIGVKPTQYIVALIVNDLNKDMKEKQNA